ncbi:PQQ-binding-like beta-propeller repeat protein [Streptomyces sp. NPDC086519]|uniref:outer membrane protein assembly factor BamB family protein n=1 Tax=Streptomyces sp. NPDC086519 TaxID=3154863 RepID=UPI0034172CDC
MGRAEGFGQLEAEDPEQVGPYRTVALLGAGGMGRVYLAVSRGGRPVAVKVIRPDVVRNGQFRRRFAREVAAARAVSGVFTAAVVDADTEATTPWLATAYVPGVSLNDAVAEAGPLPAMSVWRLAAGLAEALEAIHRAGVVHRDLKPSNVLLAADGPRVIDFGISVMSDASALTTTGVAVGTPAFMSPEQLTTDHPVGPATDVFALGGVVTYAVTGVGPFGEGPTHRVMYRIVNEEPQLDRVPESLRGVVAGCLQKEPRHRLEVGELLGLLEETVPAGSNWSADTAGWLPAAVAGLVTRRAEIPHPPTEPDPAARRTRRSPSPDAGGEAGAATTRTTPRPPQAPQTPGEGGRRAAPRSPDAGKVPGPKQAPSRARTNESAAVAGAAAEPAAQAAGAADWARRTVVGLGGTAVVGGLGYGGWRALKWLGGAVEDMFPDAFMADSEQRWVFTGGMDEFFVDDSSPAVSGGIVYVGAQDAGSRDHLYALDAGTGRRRWSFRTQGRTGSPVVSGGTVYVADDNNYLYALDAATGRRDWTTRLQGSMETPAPPRVVDGVLYATSAAMSAAGFFGYVYAFDARDGSLRWRFKAGSVIRSSPCVSTGVVFVGSFDHNVYALDAASGRRRWVFRTGDQVSGSPVVSGGIVFVGSDDHHLYALDAATGRKRWAFAADAPVRASAAVSGGIVCAGTGDHGDLYGVDAATGRQRWKTAFDSGIASAALTAAAGLIYLGVDGHLFAVDAKSGRKRWKSAMGKGGTNSASSPAVAGDVAYISGYGAVYAVSEKGKSATASASP